ncbi:MAG: bifunctional UDP-N-acetylglucosamine diphosphorylase/glucosamine-1-phosphate N-acetyltransferase GlmU [Comamonadaceae bacterium]|nr:bifunctional UDP-N-acetylglucosamine diphosphorylase/glucosamine-1-phosphate N-acetyltransferase GlmU [Comamonadaceae bacterium]
MTEPIASPIFNPVDVVIMAAGKGTRMKSRLPKVLHRLAGRPLLGHVLQAAERLGARGATLVVGHGAAEVQAFCGEVPKSNANETVQLPLQFVLQEPQLGTGHAVQQAAPLLADDGVTLVLNGDVPLVEPATLQRLVAQCGGHQFALLTVDTGEDAGAYGRIVRAALGGGDAPVEAIVEARDATPAQREITEWYSGVMAAPTALLKKYLALLRNDNAQKEFYLTDVVKHAVAHGTPVVALKIDDEMEVAGVNSPVQLAELERGVQRRAATRLMESGVRLMDPARFDLRGELECGQDVEIDVGCIFEGVVSLADGVKIGAHCVIANARIETGAVIHPFTHIDGGRDGATVGAGALIGPYARLRPGARLGPEVHIGNFVEVKNSTLAAGAKANHLAYLGDATVGERVNYGAGSITANYDGANKHRTVIEADVHVGSNCVLVAPVTLGAGATIGGGSTITKNVPEGALSVARGKQTTLAQWDRPKKAT